MAYRGSIHSTSSLFPHGSASPGSRRALSSSRTTGAADASIGTNFFDGQRVLFDGPGSRLGLNVAVVPEPGGVMMLVAGAIFLAAFGRRRMQP